MEIPFVGGTYQSRSSNLNAQVCQNLYPVVDKEGGKKVLSLANTPGLRLFSSIHDAPVRGLHVMNDVLYAVIGNSAFSVGINGTATILSGSLDSYNGFVWMANNGGEVMVVDDGAGYIIESGTLSKITASGFPIPRGLAYQDGYFITSAKDSGRFFISGSYDGTSWDALDYATAEGFADKLQTVLSVNRELWLLGSESYEVWYNSGAADFPFERVQGAVNKVGCEAPASAVEFQGMGIWLDNQRVVRATGGYGSQKISTPQVEYNFAQYGTVNDAQGFAYSQEGHTFYILTFPTESKTWVYDFNTQFWHTRASGDYDARHPANCYALFQGKHIVGDYRDGKLFEYDLGYFSDNGDKVRRVRTAQSVNGERRPIFHNCLEIEFESGVGLIDGTNPQAMLQWSDDGGHTWSHEQWRSIGLIGKYKNRARWHRLGQARDRIYRVTISDAVKTVILGANLEAAIGMN